MKYVCDIIIDKPLAEVVVLFDNPDNLKEWMDGLQSFEHVDGEPGQPGAKSNLNFLHKNKEMVLVETIIERSLPEKFSASYDSGMGYNEVTVSFEEVNANQTKYTTHQFFDLKGFMKIVGFLFPGTFKKQSMVYLNAFKTFAEKQ